MSNVKKRNRHAIQENQKRERTSEASALDDDYQGRKRSLEYAVQVQTNQQPPITATTGRGSLPTEWSRDARSLHRNIDPEINGTWEFTSL